MGREQAGREAGGEAGRSPWQSASRLLSFPNMLQPDEQVVHFLASGLPQ